jgi:hypothetical protein
MSFYVDQIQQTCSKDHVKLLIKMLVKVNQSTCNGGNIIRLFSFFNMNRHFTKKKYLIICELHTDRPYADVVVDVANGSPPVRFARAGQPFIYEREPYWTATHVLKDG